MANDGAPSALGRLAKLLEMVEGGADPVTANDFFATFFEDASIEALGGQWRAGHHKVVPTLVRLGGRKGWKEKVERLERAIREAAARQTRAEVDAQRQKPERGALYVADALGAVLGKHELPPALRVPDGWDLSPLGVVKLGGDEDDDPETVTHRPVLIEGRYRDVQDNGVSYALSWTGASGVATWHVHPVPRAKAADARGLVAFAAQDAPVNSNNAGDLVSYLADFEAANAATIPEALVTTQMGWQGSGEERCFLWGRTVVRPGALLTTGALEDIPPARWLPRQLHLLVTEPGVRALADGFRSKGTWEGWVTAIRHALPYPAVMLGIYASLAPPLIGLLPGLPNFIVDFCGETSRGKTTTLRVAASAWGCTDERGGGLIASWDNTRVYVERAAALTNYLPTFLDDTKRAKRPEDVSRTLYDFYSGIGRGRGSLTGIQKTTRTHGVLLSTGEAPATSFSNDGGTRARTLCIWGSPFGGCDASTAAAVQRLDDGILDHYGHAGPKILQILMEQSTTDLEKLYRSCLEGWRERCNGNPVAGRAAQYIAAMEVVKIMLHEPLGVPAPAEDPLLLAWAAVVKASAEADRAADALRAVVSWATSQQHRFFGRLEGEAGSDDTPAGGWLGAWSPVKDWKTLAILPTELRGFLEKQKFDADAIIRTWEQREWLVRGDGRHLAKKVLIGVRYDRCITVKRGAVDGVGEDS